jgi:hypothetical protein
VPADTIPFMAERVLSETPEVTVYGHGPFDDEGRAIWEITRKEWKPGASGANEATIDNEVSQARGQLQTFIDTPNAQITTFAQLVPIVKVLCRVCVRLIRLRLRQLDGTD